MQSRFSNSSYSSSSNNSSSSRSVIAEATSTLSTVSSETEKKTLYFGFVYIGFYNFSKQQKDQKKVEGEGAEEGEESGLVPVQAFPITENHAQVLLDCFISLDEHSVYSYSVLSQVLPNCIRRFHNTFCPTDPFPENMFKAVRMQFQSDHEQRVSAILNKLSPEQRLNKLRPTQAIPVEAVEYIYGSVPLSTMPEWVLASNACMAFVANITGSRASTLAAIRVGDINIVQEGWHTPDSLYRRMIIAVSLTYFKGKPREKCVTVKITIEDERNGLGGYLKVLLKHLTGMNIFKVKREKWYRKVLQQKLPGNRRLFTKSTLLLTEPARQQAEAEELELLQIDSDSTADRLRESAKLLSRMFSIFAVKAGFPVGFLRLHGLRSGMIANIYRNLSETVNGSLVDALILFNGQWTAKSNNPTSYTNKAIATICDLGAIGMTQKKRQQAGRLGISVISAAAAAAAAAAESETEEKFNPLIYFPSLPSGELVLQWNQNAKYQKCFIGSLFKQYIQSKLKNNFNLANEYGKIWFANETKFQYNMAMMTIVAALWFDLDYGVDVRSEFRSKVNELLDNWHNRKTGKSAAWKVDLEDGVVEMTEKEEEEEEEEDDSDNDDDIKDEDYRSSEERNALYYKYRAIEKSAAKTVVLEFLMKMMNVQDWTYENALKFIKKTVIISYVRGNTSSSSGGSATITTPFGQKVAVNQLRSSERYVLVQQKISAMQAETGKRRQSWTVEQEKALILGIFDNQADLMHADVGALELWIAHQKFRNTNSPWVQLFNSGQFMDPPRTLRMINDKFNSLFAKHCTEKVEVTVNAGDNQTRQILDMRPLVRIYLENSNAVQRKYGVRHQVIGDVHSNPEYKAIMDQLHQNKKRKVQELQAATGASAQTAAAAISSNRIANPRVMQGYIDIRTGQPSKAMSPYPSLSMAALAEDEPTVAAASSQAGGRQSAAAAVAAAAAVTVSRRQKKAADSSLAYVPDDPVSEQDALESSKKLPYKAVSEIVYPPINMYIDKFLNKRDARAEHQEFSAWKAANQLKIPSLDSYLDQLVGSLEEAVEATDEALEEGDGEDW